MTNRASNPWPRGRPRTWRGGGDAGDHGSVRDRRPGLRLAGAGGGHHREARKKEDLGRAGNDCIRREKEEDDGRRRGGKDRSRRRPRAIGRSRSGRRERWARQPIITIATYLYGRNDGGSNGRRHTTPRRDLRTDLAETEAVLAHISNQAFRSGLRNKNTNEKKKPAWASRFNRGSFPSPSSRSGAILLGLKRKK